MYSSYKALNETKYAFNLGIEKLLVSLFYMMAGISLVIIALFSDSVFIADFIIEISGIAFLIISLSFPPLIHYYKFNNKLLIDFNEKSITFKQFGTENVVINFSDISSFEKIKNSENNKYLFLIRFIKGSVLSIYEFNNLNEIDTIINKFSSSTSDNEITKQINKEYVFNNFVTNRYYSYLFFSAGFLIITVYLFFYITELPLLYRFFPDDYENLAYNILLVINIIVVLLLILFLYLMIKTFLTKNVISLQSGYIEKYQKIGTSINRIKKIDISINNNPVFYISFSKPQQFLSFLDNIELDKLIKKTDGANPLTLKSIYLKFIKSHKYLDLSYLRINSFIKIWKSLV